MKAKEMMRDSLKNNDISIKSGTDVNSVMGDMMSVFLEGSLDEELWYSKYPEAVRRLIYTTNAIEGFNWQLRKVKKSKTIFPSDDSLFKMLYLATMDITKKWIGHRQDWGQIHSQLEIYFEERLENRNF